MTELNKIVSLALFLVILFLSMSLGVIIAVAVRLSTIPKHPEPACKDATTTRTLYVASSAALNILEIGRP